MKGFVGVFIGKCHMEKVKISIILVIFIFLDPVNKNVNNRRRKHYYRNIVFEFLK